MRLNTGGTRSGQAKNARQPRQLYKLALAAVFLLTACGRSETDRATEAAANAANPGGLSLGREGLSRVIASSTGFAAVAADESRAAEIGRDILLDGGNATDAAAAMYFAMAVTLPSAASIGSSGACIVHDDKTKAAEAFVFPPVAAPGPIAGQPFTVPASVRGIALMHVRHGVARWEQVVAPAERLARLGVPVSRALARDLQVGGGALLADREAQRIFGKGGGMPTEGNLLVQRDLGTVLGAIRQRGGGDFFTGVTARAFSEQVAQAGGNLPVDALRSVVPQAGPPMTEDIGTFTRRRLYVAPAPAAGAQALAAWKGQPVTGTVPISSGGFAGVVAADAKAGAAACAFSMGQLFGAHVIVPGTGVLLAAPTPDAGSVSPVIVANPGNGEFNFAGAGGGGPTAAQAVGAVARATIEQDQKLAAVLQARGGQGGYVNAIACPSGLRGGADSCRSVIDPASPGGLALVAR